MLVLTFIVRTVKHWRVILRFLLNDFVKTFRRTASSLSRHQNVLPKSFIEDLKIILQCFNVLIVLPREWYRKGRLNLFLAFMSQTFSTQNVCSNNDALFVRPSPICQWLCLLFLFSDFCFRPNHSHWSIAGNRVSERERYSMTQILAWHRS